MNEAKFRPLLIRLPVALDHALRRRAAKEDRPLSWVTRKALIGYLNPSEGEDDLLYWAWTIIANAGGGDWDREAPEWKQAATDWRDAFHAMLDSGAVEKPIEKSRDAMPDGHS